MRRFTCCTTGAVVAILWLTMFETTQADVPNLINYQGVLTDSTGSVLPDSTYTVVFGIYADTATATLPVWFENQLVSTVNGLFHILLGTTEPIDYWSTFLNLPTPHVAYLGVRIGSDPELKPRTRLVSVPFAIAAQRADAVGSIANASGGTVIGDLNATGKLQAQSNRGPLIPSPVGDRWKDNSIVAWGHILPDGTIANDYNVVSVSHSSIGTYGITVSGSADSLAATVPLVQSIFTGGPLQIAQAESSSPGQLAVKIFDVITGSPADGEFYVLVTGR